MIRNDEFLGFGLLWRKAWPQALGAALSIPLAHALIVRSWTINVLAAAMGFVTVVVVTGTWRRR